MKKFISSIVATVAMIALTLNVSAQNEVAQKGAKIEFSKEVHDYGEVAYGGDGFCTFEFKNTGNVPLVLSSVKGSCSCTVPEWPKAPIAPGETGVLKVRYDTRRAGAINKSVTINSNAINTPVKVVRIKGNVLPQPTSGTPVNTTGAPVN